MAISPYKTWDGGEILTAADLNSSFSQITNNGEDVPFPSTKAVDFNAQQLKLDADADTILEASTDDQINIQVGGAANVVVLTATSFKFNGAEIGADGGDAVLAAQVFS